MRKIHLALFCITPAFAYAEEAPKPSSSLGERDALLKVEDFSPSSGRLSVNYGFTYNAQRKDGYIPNILYVPGIDGSTVIIPGLRATADRSDSILGTVGLRYNVASLFNVSAQLSGGYRYERLTSPYLGTREQNSFDLDALSLGADMRLTPATSRLYANGFVSVGAIEKSADRFSYGKSITGGVSAHFTADPLIFSTTIAYSKFLERSGSKGRFEPGDVLSMTPSVGFAVNPDINLSWGMTFAFRDGDKYEGRSKGDWNSASTLNFGVGYRLDENRLLNISARAGVGGNSAMQISTSMTQRF
ncbi:hypothetical protein [Rhodopseudomonas sp.]|uniref:hypothetical protein n=1 Tax=Rhodopseudomonas sp. TaxID=1078 RepID=UPI0039E4E51E